MHPSKHVHIQTSFIHVPQPNPNLNLIQIPQIPTPSANLNNPYSSPKSSHSYNIDLEKIWN